MWTGDTAAAAVHWLLTALMWLTSTAAYMHSFVHTCYCCTRYESMLYLCALFVRVSMCPSMCVLFPVDANVAAVSEAPRPRVCYTLKPVLLKPVFLPVDTHRNPTCLLHTRWSSPLSHHFYPSTPTLTNPTCLLHTQQCSSRWAIISTGRHPTHPVSMPILHPRAIQALWSQNY